MRLDELINGIDALDMGNLYPDMEVGFITSDSREVGPGAVFVAIPGTVRDGHDYIDQALEAGATLIVQKQPLDTNRVGSFLRVKDPREAYAQLCARIFDNPSRKLRVIGVTGTNGKTSTTLITRHLLEQAGYRCAALGTLGLYRSGAAGPEMRGLTTPDAGMLQRIMAQLVEEGTTHLVMEVSSHALVQHRVTGTEFTGAAFTNISQDHFDYHGTLDAYIEAKASLFMHHLVVSGGYAVLNTDDEAGADYARRFSGICVKYGSAVSNNLVLMEIVNAVQGLKWEMILKNGVWPADRDPQVNHARINCPLVGRYNVYNCAAAAGIALLEGLSLGQVVDGLATFANVPGRLQSVPNDRGLHVFVDYAHTPDALENVLKALREVRGPGAQVITVFGCGGDRDRKKRPLMGAAAQGLSDRIIVTSDNPRTEDPGAIIDDIYTGLDTSAAGVSRCDDRAEAIRLAITSAKPGDIILIAGKGHEDYQIIGERTIHFSDSETAGQFLNQG